MGVFTQEHGGTEARGNVHNTRQWTWASFNLASLRILFPAARKWKWNGNIWCVLKVRPDIVTQLGGNVLWHCAEGAGTYSAQKHQRAVMIYQQTRGKAMNACNSSWDITFSSLLQNPTLSRFLPDIHRGTLWVCFLIARSTGHSLI